MTACAVTGKNPFEMKIGQASHGADLLGPVMPASVSGRKKSLFYGIPGQMIAREQKFFPEQAAGSGRVPRNRDAPKVRKQGPDLVSPEKDFDAAGLFPEIRFMEYPGRCAPCSVRWDTVLRACHPPFERDQGRTMADLICHR